MRWPFPDDAPITQRFGDPRERGQHRAWDIASPNGKRGELILAPEDGSLIMFAMRRTGYGTPLSNLGEWMNMAGRVMPSELSSYSWYWADRYGLISVLKARERWWLFAHNDPPGWWDLMQGTSAIEYNFARGPGVPPSWKAEIHWGIRRVSEGDLIGFIGNSGISTGPHCHMEIASVGYARGASSRIDPQSLFPDK